MSELRFGVADPAYAATADADACGDSSLVTEDAEELEQQAHVEAATEAQGSS